MSRSDPTTKQQIDTVQHYLEREFPGRVRNRRWNRHTGMHVFEVVHDTTVHRVEMPAAFFVTCPNCTDALRFGELTDYMREARAQMRHFRVVWEDGVVRVRSTAL